MSKFFSLAYLTLPNTHPVDQIEIAAQCGYEGVGLRTISQHLPGEPDYALANGRMFQMVRAALERTGVRLMDIELARVADGVDVMSYEKEFALGAELGAKYAIASVWSADRDFSRVQFEKMCDLADKYGMKLNLEFVPFSNIPGLTEALAWMDLMDRPNVLKVFIHAPLEARLARVASYSLAWSQHEVARHIRVEDKRRAAYYHYYTGEEWRDAAGYDLSLDTDKLGEDGCVEFIKKILPLYEK